MTFWVLLTLTNYGGLVSFRHTDKTIWGGVPSILARWGCLGPVSCWVHPAVNSDITLGNGSKVAAFESLTYCHGACWAIHYHLCLSFSENSSWDSRDQLNRPEASSISYWSRLLIELLLKNCAATGRCPFGRKYSRCGKSCGKGNLLMKPFSCRNTFYIPVPIIINTNKNIERCQDCIASGTVDV